MFTFIVCVFVAVACVVGTFLFMRANKDKVAAVDKVVGDIKTEISSITAKVATPVAPVVVKPVAPATVAPVSGSKV